MPTTLSSSITGSFRTFRVDIKSEATHKSELGSIEISLKTLFFSQEYLGIRMSSYFDCKISISDNSNWNVLSNTTIAPTPVSSIIFAASVAVTDESTETIELFITSLTQVFCCIGSGEFIIQFY